MKARLFFWSLTSALAGFLFGFDTVVISGVEQKIQSLWNLSAAMHGLAMGSALYGTVALAIGLLAGWPLDEVHQRATEVAAYVCSQPGGTPELPEHLRAPFRVKQLVP